MAIRMGAQGRVTIPKQIRETLQLAAGDRIEFGIDANGVLTVRKLPGAPAPTPERPVQRSAAELFAVLRALD